MNLFVSGGLREGISSETLRAHCQARLQSLAGILLLEFDSTGGKPELEKNHKTSASPKIESNHEQACLHGRQVSLNQLTDLPSRTINFLARRI